MVGKISTLVDEMMSRLACEIILGAQKVRHLQLLQLGCKCLCEFCEGHEIEHNDKWSSEPHCCWKVVGIQELKCVMCNSDKLLRILCLYLPFRGCGGYKTTVFPLEKKKREKKR